MFDFSSDRSGLAIVLVDGFSLLSLGAILEPLRFLGERYPQIAPSFELFSVQGRQAVSRCGVAIDCDFDLGRLTECLQSGPVPRAVLICSGTDVLPADDNGLIKLLRQINRLGVTIHAIGRVTLLMAKAGVLSGRKGTTHWTSLAPLRENHLDVDVRNALFVSDGPIGCCAGESATLDLMLDIIAAMSPAAAASVANYFLVSAPRHGDTVQPGSQLQRLRNVPQTLFDAVKTMAEHLEDPLQIRDIADICGVSSRKLERLFREHLAASPLRFYRSLRLERALELVSQTNLTIPEIAAASGFGSTGALNKYFRAEYNETPAQVRKRGALSMTLQRHADPCERGFPAFPEVFD